MCKIEALCRVKTEQYVCAPLERFTPSMPCRRALFSRLSWRWAPLSIGLHEGGAGQLVDGDSCVTDSPRLLCVRVRVCVCARVCVCMCVCVCETGVSPLPFCWI